VAIVVGKAGAKLEPQLILAQLKSTLANFKIPKRCFVVGDLPRNAMGKVQKAVLRAEYGPR
jgi:malonyl-CoA/methylmalonyl-CoA synthetase